MCVSLNKYDNKLAKIGTLMCCVVNINNLNFYSLNAAANLSKFLQRRQILDLCARFEVRLGLDKNYFKWSITFAIEKI